MNRFDHISDGILVSFLYGERVDQYSQTWIKNWTGNILKLVNKMPSYPPLAVAIWETNLFEAFGVRTRPFEFRAVFLHADWSVERLVVQAHPITLDLTIKAPGRIVKPERLAFIEYMEALYKDPKALILWMGQHDEDEVRKHFPSMVVALANRQKPS